jgi:hypothetical protein
MNKPNFETCCKTSYTFLVHAPGIERFFEEVPQETTIGDFKITIIQKIALKALQGKSFRNDYGGKKALESLLKSENIKFSLKQKCMDDNQETLKDCIEKKLNLKRIAGINLKLILKSDKK